MEQYNNKETAQRRLQASREYRKKVIRDYANIDNCNDLYQTVYDLLNEFSDDIITCAQESDDTLRSINRRQLREHEQDLCILIIRLVYDLKLETLGIISDSDDEYTSSLESQ